MNILRCLITALLFAGALTLPLDDFVKSPDASYSFTTVNTTTLGTARVVILDMVSQTWNETTTTVWHHWLTICIPASPITNIGVLYIDGDDSTTPAPTGPDSITTPFCANGIVSATLLQVPNQPLVFTTDPLKASKVEDEILAYSWRRYLDTGNPNTLVWFAMAKAGVRALDTIQNVTSINKFILAGSSKRGWASWLTAAAESRVVGVLAVVAPVFKMKDFLNTQYTNLGNFTYALSWYEDQGVLAQMNNPNSLSDSFFELVDANAYLARLTMPKYFVDVTGDQFFLLDIINPFIQTLSGPTNLRMVPNTDHGFTGSSPPLADVAAFVLLTVQGVSLPQLQWSLQTSSGSTVVNIVADTAHPAATLVTAYLWTANTASTTKRDFRMFTCRPTYVSDPTTDPCYQSITWTKTVVSPNANSNSQFSVTLQHPTQGWMGGFVEFVYNNPQLGNFSVTTDVNVVPNTHPFAPCPCNGTSSSTTTTTTSSSTTSNSTTGLTSTTSSSTTSGSSFVRVGLGALVLVALSLMI